jgi:outer membrane biosynthesis protein TonB
MALSIALHAAVFGLGWLSTFHRPPTFEFIAFEIELVSPPPAVQAEVAAPPREELVIERPEPEPEPSEPEPEPDAPRLEPDQPEPEPEPEPQREPEPEPEPEPPEPDVEPAPATAPEPPPEEPPPTSGEGLNVRLEGLRRDYPEYYNNIIRQIQRCFRWQGGGTWETQVSFVIRRDGTVSDLEFVTRSGNTSFDFEAMGAVDCAGQGRFGPLPEDLPYESLPVLFDFRPTGRMEIPSTTGLTAGVAS